MTSTQPTFWGSYALGLIDDVQVGPAIVEYLRRIESTLEPFGGAFLVHGLPWRQVEGDAVGDPVLIAFPEPSGAAQWYESSAYQELIPLRGEHSRSRIILLQGVDATHRSADVIDVLTA